MITRRTINSMRQNKPSQIVRDLIAYAPPGVVYESLLTRGVFKWLAARRDFILLKDLWKHRITKSIEDQKQSRGAKVNYWRGYRKALEECRAELRDICHSDRWRLQDNDHLAKRWMMLYEKALNNSIKEDVSK